MMNSLKNDEEDMMIDLDFEDDADFDRIDFDDEDLWM